MTNLFSFCKMVVSAGRENRADIANVIMDCTESVHEGEQELAWKLMRSAGMPFYERAAFLAAADLALEIVNGGNDDDKPPIRKAA